MSIARRRIWRAAGNHEYRWWPLTYPINTVIPASPVLDAESTAIAQALISGTQVLNVIEYGVPIVYATAATPRWAIVPTNTGAWGPNPFQGRTIPMDMTWKPQSVAADGALVVVDTDAKTCYGFYELDLSGPAPVCTWGEVSDRTSMTLTTITGKATGCGVPRGAGIIREEEWARGFIDHALVFSTDIARPTTFRVPATSTDGANLAGGSVTIQEGTRIQLDPTLNVDAQSWLPFRKIIAKALQTYGAYCIDNGGAVWRLLQSGRRLQCRLTRPVLRLWRRWVLRRIITHCRIQDRLCGAS